MDFLKSSRSILTAAILSVLVFIIMPVNSNALEANAIGGYGLLISSDHEPAKAVKGGVKLTIIRDDKVGFVLYNESGYMKYKVGESEKQYGMTYLLLSKSFATKKGSFWSGVYVIGGFGAWNKFESGPDPTNFALTARAAADIPYVRLELAFDMASIDGANEIFLGGNIVLIGL